MATGELYFVSALAEDDEVISYRPKIARALGHDADAAILLQRIARYWVTEWNGHKARSPFYKFKEPGQAHKKYRPGDSWVEELVSTRRKFEGALNVIGTKITKGTSKSELLSVVEAEFDERGVIKKEVGQRLTVYWTDGDRLTWYLLNERLFESLCRRLYLCNVQNDFSFNPNVQNDLNMETDDSVLHDKGKTSVSCADSIYGSPDGQESHTHAQNDPPPPLYVSSESERDKQGSKKSGSIHDIKVLAAYLEFKKSQGEPILSVDAVATVRARDGLIDEFVSAWLAARDKPNVNDCPDCHGGGYNQRVYLEQDGKMERCDHRALYGDKGSA